MRSRSVHGFGLVAPLQVIAIDRGGVVVGVGVLRPRRLAIWRRACWIAELPDEIAAPAIGTRLRLERIRPV